MPVHQIQHYDLCPQENLVVHMYSVYQYYCANYTMVINCTFNILTNICKLAVKCIPTVQCQPGYRLYSDYQLYSFYHVWHSRSRGPEFDPSQVPYFVEIDDEIISTAILLPSADSRRFLSVTSKNTSLRCGP